MKKIIKIISILAIILISNFSIIANTVQAVENQITIYTKGNFNRILKYDGVLLKTAHAVYQENGVEYPVYCLNVDLQGVGDKVATYNTTNQGKITDVNLWRVIINGYPYKSLQELGVASEEEAYIATKQSIYCYLFNRVVEKYTGVNEAGNRVKNAIATILKNAQDSTEEIGETKVEVVQPENWTVEKNYIVKEYEVKSNINISKYIIKLENQPKGTKITDSQNNEKQEFISSEKFKILIPISSLTKSGQFKINITSQLETKPVFYGKAPSSDLQDYALTAFSYENKDIELLQEYEPNETEIKIEKQDEETKEMLKGAKFEILDENKKLIKVVETDKNGKIELKQIMPGIYYIREIEAPEGYELNTELRKVQISFNKKITLKIGNSKIIVEEIPIEIPPVEETPIPEIPRLPVTGM